MWFWIEQNILFPLVFPWTGISTIMIILRGFGLFKKWPVWFSVGPFVVTVIFWFGIFIHCVVTFSPV